MYGSDCAQVLYNIERGFGNVYPADEANFAEEEEEEEEETEDEGDYDSNEDSEDGEGDK